MEFQLGFKKLIDDVGLTRIFNNKVPLYNSRAWGIPTVDPDAVAFLTATGITDETIASAINTLVVNLKSIGLWSKMKAIYPFVGGTATTHKFNLKDPRDLDIAFRLEFFGGITHNLTGIFPNGTNGYAKTFLNPSISLLTNNTHLSYYSRSSDARNQADIGCEEGGSSSARLVMVIRWGDGVFYSDMYSQQSGGGRIAYSHSDGSGFWVNSRIANNSHIIYKSGSQVASNTSTTNILQVPNNDLLLFANRSFTSVLAYSNRPSSFISIGDGLNATDNTNLNSIVNSFQTNLNRQL